MNRDGPLSLRAPWRRKLGEKPPTVISALFMVEASTQTADPVVAWLLRTPSGLRAGGRGSVDHQVLATYCHDDGSHPFAICRDGLLIDPDVGARFVAFHEIDDAGLFDRRLLEREKDARRQSGTVGATSLVLTLATGEILTLPLNVRPDGMSERLAIARLIASRITIAKSQLRRAQSAAV